MWVGFFVPQAKSEKDGEREREKKKLTFVEQEVKPIKNPSYSVKKKFWIMMIEKRPYEYYSFRNMSIFADKSILRGCKTSCNWKCLL